MKIQNTCKRCVMDTTAPEIKFFDDGRCTFCKHYDEVNAKDLFEPSEGEKRINRLAEKIKKESKGKKYNCLIGVSGGVDSSYVAYLVKKKLGLSPLALHLDNGWNSELATANVENLLKNLDIDLETKVLNWNEFRDIQKSFLKSSITNIEIPTDHAIWASLAQTASKHNIKYIFSGNNVATEAIMPESWLYGSKDSNLIKNIQKKFGTLKIKDFPMLSLFDYIYYFLFRGIKWIPILNYMEYNKDSSKEILINDLKWRDYGGKHYESIFTRFFHAYYMPKKYRIDLRKSYLSASICSGQISRRNAIAELENDAAELSILEQDELYVKKKLGFSDDEFQKIMKSPRKYHYDYGSDEKIWKYFSKLVAWARKRITKV